jgi:hypothetical protein
MAAIEAVFSHRCKDGLHMLRGDKGCTRQQCLGPRGYQQCQARPR